MAAHNIGTRVTTLRNEQLPQLGAKWRGTPEEFLEFLYRVIPQMPPLVKDAMERYYLSGETQRLNEVGKPEAKDSRYYLLLLQGRGIVATMINTAQNDKRPLRLLELIYAK